MKERVLDILMSGERYTGKQLAKLVGTDEPTIRAIIHSIRCVGVPVCSNRRGYYISTDEDEILKTISSIEGRIFQMEKAVEGLKRGLM